MRVMTVALALAVAAAGMAGCAHITPRFTTTNVPVNVTITCTGQGVQFSVSPYSVQLNVGDGVDWNLVGSPNVSEISINRKSGHGWPYTSAPPYTGGSNVPAKARGMNPNAGGRYPYTISGNCIAADGSTRAILIDPDMIVIRGGTT